MHARSGPLLTYVTRAAAIVAMLVAGVPAAAAAPVLAPLDALPTGGTIDAVAVDGHTAYVGGSFRGFGSDIGGFAVTDPTTGVADLSAPRSPGSAGPFLPDGSGGMYVAGDLTVGGTDHNGVEHVRADGTIDPAFSVNIGTGRVMAMVVIGSDLYVGGSFTTVDGSSGSDAFLAAVHLSDGSLVTGFDPRPKGVVRALAAGTDPTGAHLYVGGDFKEIADITAHAYLAAVSPTTGALYTTFAASVNDRVYALATTGSGSTLTVYAGGQFVTAGTVSRSGLAGFARTGAVTPLNVPVGTAMALLVDSPTLYVGIDDPPGLVAVDLTTNALVPGFTPNFTREGGAAVTSLALSGSTLYVGGLFAAAGPGANSPGGGTLRTNFAAVDRTTGALTAWDPGVDEPNAGTFDLGWFVSVSGQQVDIGGDFHAVTEAPRAHLAAYDLDTGALDAWAPSVDGPVSALAVQGSSVFAGGSFQAPRTGLAGFDATTGALLPFDARLNGFVGTIYPTATSIFIGGSFTEVNDFGASRFTQRLRLAEIDTSTSLATPFNPGLSLEPLAIVARGSTVFVGGIIANQPSDRLLLGWDESANGPGVEDAFPGKADGVDALALDGSTLYVGGLSHASDATVTNSPRQGIAAFDLDTGTLTSFDADLDGVPYGLDAINGRLYAGGDFTQGLASLDPTSGARATWTPQLNGQLGPDSAANGEADALSGSPESGIVAVGVFANAAGTPVDGIAHYLVPASAPVNVSASARDGSASVAFTAPAGTGGSPVTGYTVTAAPGGITAAGSSSPIVVGGLADGTAYTFTVTATNLAGDGLVSDPSAAVTPTIAIPPPPPHDTIAPVITAFKASPTRFVVAEGKTAQAAKAARRTPHGTIFSFRLSEPAKTALTIARRVAGRRRGKLCVKPRKGLRRTCVRSVRVVTLTRADAIAGLNTVAFTGRVGKLKLAAGKYVASLVATDASANRSIVRTVSFTVVAAGFAAPRSNRSP